jgi:hypothetical protein
MLRGDIQKGQVLENGQLLTSTKDNPLNFSQKTFMKFFPPFLRGTINPVSIKNFLYTLKALLGREKLYKGNATVI